MKRTKLKTDFIKTVTTQTTKQKQKQKTRTQCSLAFANTVSQMLTVTRCIFVQTVEATTSIQYGVIEIKKKE